MDTTLSALLASCNKGSPAAQHQLFKQYKNTLFGVCLRYARDRPEAEDLLQESFIVIFRDIAQYKGEGAFEGWLRKVTVRVALQSLRRKNPLRYAEDYAELSADTFDYEPDSTFNAEHILRLVQQLPSGCRVIFNLHCVEGYAYAEIAEALGLHESSVRAQYARACKHLRTLVEKSLLAA
jgi:RNA polymerase sigma factor (sigma-70 family)